MFRSVYAFAVLGVVALMGACSSSGLGDATGATCPPNSTLTYDNFGKDFISKNCLSCHAGKEDPRLDSVEAVRAHKGEIDRAAAKGPNATNTYMPDGRSLSDDERTKLGEWLACGAK